MRIPFLILAACGLGLAGAALAAPAPRASTPPRFVPFEVIVKFKPGTQTAALKTQIPDVALLSQPGRFSIARLDTPTPRLYRRDEARAETLALLARLRQRDDVQYAQLNYLFDLAYTPNDPLYVQQWHFPAINLPSAWDITRGSRAARIAILDTGRTGHPDLLGRWSALEYNAASPGSSAEDTGNWRHGTHVAGIAGAATDNGIGVAGVCPSCTLLNVKVADAGGSLSMASVVNGVHWAVDNGARVINMSFESGRACTQADFPALRDAIARATDHGVNLVAAAGNNAVDVASVTPASCPGVISVAATDRNNNLAVYSSRGASVGISAPGGGGVHTPPYSAYGEGVGCPPDPDSAFHPFREGVLSTWTTSPSSGNVHCYRYLSGTSMAAPHVAGAIGLILSANPGLRPEQVTDIVRGTASALPACGFWHCGPGLLNASAAVNRARTTTTGPCSAAAAGNCAIDAIGQYRNASGALVESVYAYGRLWQFDAAGSPIGVAKRLRAFPRYASGPCAHAPAGQDCTIDSSTVLDYPGFGYLESVTAYGRYWNFDQNGNGLGGNGSLLSSVPRYAKNSGPNDSGPCAYAGSPSACKFDTRNLIDSPEWGGLFESITAYGRYWIFDAAGNQLGTDSLLSVPRYASGPCAYRPAGATCVFDSRELRRVPGSGGLGLYETITAYGRYFEWDGNGNPTGNHGQLLSAIPRLR